MQSLGPPLSHPSVTSTIASATSNPITAGYPTRSTCSSTPMGSCGSSIWRLRPACNWHRPVRAVGDDPKFSPDGNYLSYVRGHNLYVNKLKDNNPPLRLTDSQADALLDGEVDWVYEEELDVRSNYFWSPDSRRIAYLEMNEAPKRPEYPIENWIPTHATVDRQRYPQPGDPNPVVRVGVVGANGGRTKWINLPIDNGSDYVPPLWMAQSQDSCGLRH